MKNHSLPNYVRQCSTRRLAIILAVQFLALGLGHAGGRPTFKWQSDRVITIREVLSVEIEADTISILAKAHEPKAPSLPYLGKQIYLVVKRPPLNFKDGHLQTLLASPRRGSTAKELDRKQFKRHRAHLWASTVLAARALKKGGEIEFIAYFKPEIEMTGDYITSVEGHGFLFPKTK